MAVPAHEWISIRDWAVETGNLEFWQRGLADSLSKYAEDHRTPSPKQAKQGLRILHEAREAGFIATPN